MQALGIALISGTFSVIAPLRGRIIGGDAPLEIHVIQTISESGVWNLPYGMPVGPLLHNPFIVSVEKITSVDLITIFNIYSSFLTVPIALATFIFLRKYFSGYAPFLLTAFIIFQYSMVRSGLGGIRATTSILFFVLFIYAISVDHKPLQILTLLATVLAYYSVAVFLAIFISLVYFLNLISGYIESPVNELTNNHAKYYKIHDNIRPAIVGLTITLCVGWLIHIGLLHHVVIHLEMIFSLENLFQSSSSSSSSGQSEPISLPDLFIYATVGGTLSIMGFGSLIIMLRGISDWSTIHSLIFASLAISVVAVGTPMFSEARVSVTSIYRQTVFFLMLGIPIGIMWLVKRSPCSFLPGSDRKLGVILLAIVIVLQLPAFTGMAYHVHDSGPELVWFEEDGEQSEIWKVEDEELAQTNFLLKHGSEEYRIHGDRYSEHRTLPYLTNDWQRPNIVYFTDEDRRMDPGYIYLRNQNVNSELIAPRGTAHADMEPLYKHAYIFENCKVYDNKFGNLYFDGG